MEESEVATIREGRSDVVLVVDFQNGVVSSAYNRDSVAKKIQEVIDRARASKVPVIWVQQSDAELVEGSAEWGIFSGLAPDAQEHRVHKKYNSCFEDTELDSILSELKATRIILTGAATNWCIRATAYGALDRGYDVTLVGDAHTTGNVALGNGQEIQAENVIKELNLTMKFLSYPGRANEVVRASTLSF